jgi:hypothetical protein
MSLRRLESDAPPTTAPGGQAPAPPVEGRSISLFGRRVPVVLPSRHDPRMKLAAVILTLQALGQTILGFKVSIAQILVCLGVCGLFDVVVAFRQKGVLAWPASGLLAGNSVAFILRTAGTRHGDWWSLHGVEYFIFACLVASFSKVLIRPGGRHIFNPSNLGIVLALAILGPTRVFPQYLWWVRAGTSLAIVMAVIFFGAVWVLSSVHMRAMALSFLLPFGALTGIYALLGRSFVAIWSANPVAGVSYWANLCLSPEVLIFVFFMMSDPQTTPKGRAERIVFGSCTALVASGLLFFQPTEFGVKLAILMSLTLVCAAVPLIDSFTPEVTRGIRPPAPLYGISKGLIRPYVVLACIGAICVGVLLSTASLSTNQTVVDIERGVSDAGGQ